LTVLLVLMLAALWGAVFLPAYLRAKQHSSPIVTVGSFRRGMRALSQGRHPNAGRWVVMPRPPVDERLAHESSIARRRRMFIALLLTVVVSLPVGLLSGVPALFWISISSTVALIAYIALLLREKEARAWARSDFEASVTEEMLEELDDEKYVSAGQL